MNRFRAVLIAAFPLLFLSLVPLASAQTRCPFSTDLHVGSRGAAVSCLQVSLLEQGYAIPAGPTGYYGLQTRAAVALWQKASHVAPAAGYFGILSRRAYSSSFASVSAPAPRAAAPTAFAAPPPPPVPLAAGGAATSAPAPALGAPSVSMPAPQSIALAPAPSGSEITGMLSSALGAPASPQGSVLWSCDFENGYCGLHEQSALEPSGHRSFFTATARTGSRAIELMTQPGDANIHGSGAWERDDLELPVSPDYCNEGQEEWWAVSVYFPADYVMPKQGMEVMDFHDNSSSGQANLNFVSDPDQVRIVGYGGDFANPTKYSVDLGPLVKERWYDLVYHVKWSSNADGFMTVWLNGKKVLTYSGPTLYKGISCYFKLADYHDALGVPEPVIFDRVVRGTSGSAVSLTPLQ